jgi:hypothetical protein
MQLLKTLSRLQWAVLLFLNIAFIPLTVYAAPVASFYADRASGLVPLFVVVDAGKSSPWEGTDRITRVEWTTSTGILIKSQIRIGIQLSTLGKQTITLTVWNAAGEKDSTTKTFEVCNEYGAKCPEPPPSPDPPPKSGGSNGSAGSTASFNVVKTEGLTVHLKVSGIQTGVAYEYRVRLETDVSPSSYYFNTEEYSIKLPEAGTYKISLYVPKKDDSGWNQLQTETVTVPKTVPDPVIITPPPVGENLAYLEFSGLEGSYNIGETVVMELAETGNRKTRVDLWVVIQLPSGILFRTDVPSSPWIPWSPNPQAHKTSIESTDTNHHIFDFELPKNIGGSYTLYAVYVEEGKKPLTDEGAYDGRYNRSNLVNQGFFLAN